MKVTLNTLKRLATRLAGRLPHKLPKSVKEFDLLAMRVCDAYGMEYNDSYRHAIATMIMHMGPLETHKSLKYFASSLKKSAANQIAYQVIQDLREAKAKEEKPAA